MDDARAAVARREAQEYRQGAQIESGIFLGIYGVGLGAMASFHASVEWLVTAGFLFGAVIVCQIVIRGFTRLDAGRVYLELVCHDMNERLVLMRWERPS